MKAAEIRQTFLKFFESKGHQIVASGDAPSHHRPSASAAA